MYKGSIAIDGISLTIAALEGDVLSVTIIPHTFRNTTLAAYRPGARVNLECDILAKHVEKLLRETGRTRAVDRGKAARKRLLIVWGGHSWPPSALSRRATGRPK